MESTKPTLQAMALRDFNQLPDDARVRVGTVAHMFGIGTATAWRWTRSGLLPQPERTGRATMWRVGDLRSHRIAA